jgi:DNA mismatch repair protein MutS
VKEKETSVKEVAETPLMKQYNQIKAKYPGALLLFRVGDFYETFGEDAVKAAQILGIVLTKRANGSASHIELAGFPYHSLDAYLYKLVRAGQRVAICDQLEDPKLTKKIVKRGVTELITPGVTYNDKVLDLKQNNYLAAVHFGKDNIGVSFLDISTGEFFVAEGGIDYIDKLLQGLRPSEVILSKQKEKEFVKLFGDKFYTYTLDEWVFQYDFTREKLLSHFETKSLKGYGIEELSCATVAAGASIHYLLETHHNHLGHISRISRMEEERYVWLDRFTIRNLELLHSPHEGGIPLIKVLDKTITPMGARLLRRWLVMPLKEMQPIQERLSIVEYACNNLPFIKILSEQLKLIGDLERIVSKVAMRRINPREVRQLHRALKAIAPIIEACSKSGNEHLVKIADQLNPCSFIIEKIEKELAEDPPMLISKGGIIAGNVNTELDELRKIAYSGKDYLLQIQQTESERTGISSLKISYNNVFGYYLEVSNVHKSKVPPEWIRKQTLTNAERYITEELKQYEEKILGAEDKIMAIEEHIFSDLVLSLADYVGPVQQNSMLIASLDCLISFAQVALHCRYVKPEITDALELGIKDCRHPVIEQQLPPGEDYVPNDIYLNNTSQQMIILTGPNMSGKSAILRQTALSVIMAQMGSFVPASFAQIGLIDKIFTRVGASDNISSGESTFMVEMMETASILNNLSGRSLILLDEIGRGTSTYDGVSLAWAIAEYLGQHPAKPKTLFATHYHELNELEKQNDLIKNYHVSVKELKNNVIFLRKMVPGGSEHSFGIHVAKMAGLPKAVVERAGEILEKLEEERSKVTGKEALKKMPKVNYQLNMFQLDDPVLTKLRDEIKKMNIDALTPIEALMKLHEMKGLMN